MKSLSKKTLSVILLVAVVLSCFAVSYGTALAEEPTYSYEKVVTVDIPMDASAWAKTVNSSDTNFNIHTVENSLTDENTLNIKSDATASSNALYVWEPYENSETKSLFDLTTVTKVELVANYNNWYPNIVSAKRTDNTKISAIVGQQRKVPNSIKVFSGENFQTTANGSGQKFTADASFNFSTLEKTSVIKTVTELYEHTDGTRAWQCTAYNVVEGVDIPMYVAKQTDSAGFNLYPAVAVFSTNANIEILSMKVTYTQTVDVTDEVKAFASDYPTYLGCESIANITANNAPTIINEIKHLKAAYNSSDSQFQSILVNAGIYDESKLDEFLSIAEKLRSGLIGQYFDTNISSATKIDNLWSSSHNVKVANGQMTFAASSSQTVNLTNGLSQAPKSLVVKFESPDLSDYGLSAGFRFTYADSTNNGEYFWVALPQKKSADGKKVIAHNANDSNIIIKGKSLGASSWSTSKVPYSDENPIVIGNYESGTYVPNELTIKIDYNYNSEKARYILSLTISDGTNSVTIHNAFFIASTLTNYSLKIGPNTNHPGGINTKNDAPLTGDCYYTYLDGASKINSIEYLMPENGVVAPTVDGVRFLDFNNGKTDITFQVSTNTASAPEGYTPIAYGAHIITNQVLNNKYDIINDSYIGKRDLPVITACKAVSDGAVPETFNVSINGSAGKLGTIDCRGVRFAAVGFVTYQTADGRQVTVYSQNTNNDRAINEGQGNRSIIGVAKIIAAYEINSMSGKDGAADANTIAAVEAIIAKTTATTDAEKDTLIKFVTDYKNFAN